MVPATRSVCPKCPRHVQVFRLVITPSLYEGLWYVHPSVTFFCLLTYYLPSLQAYDLVRTTLLITSLNKGRRTRPCSVPRLYNGSYFNGHTCVVFPDISADVASYATVIALPSPVLQAQQVGCTWQTLERGRCAPPKRGCSECGDDIVFDP